MAVELHFWQKIRGRDAEKSPRCHCQGNPQQLTLLVAKQSKTGQETDSTTRHHGCVERIHQQAQSRPDISIDHERRDDSSIKRLVKKNSQECGESGKEPGAVGGIGID